jgi:hypothetical protein
LTLRRLRESILFSADLPKRSFISHAEWASLSEEERKAPTTIEIRAIRLVPDFRELEGLIDQLGLEKSEAAVPALAQLWKECAVTPLRVAAGHALRKIGTPAARQALKEEIEGFELISSFLAVRAIFDEEPATAYQRTLHYFDESLVGAPGGAAIPGQILNLFAPSSFHGETPSWTEPRAPQWLRDDPRWLQLCVKLRKHPQLGEDARSVLRYADKAQVAEALAEGKATEGPRVLRTGKVAADLLARYRQGEHQLVWNTLRGYDRIEGALREEAVAVARETAKRVLHNAPAEDRPMESRCLSRARIPSSRMKSIGCPSLIICGLRSVGRASPAWSGTRATPRFRSSSSK